MMETWSYIFMKTIMIQIKRLLIILLVLFCCCSKSGSDEKRYKTAVSRVVIYNPEEIFKRQEIGKIPFKGRVEIVDNNEINDGYWSFIKIKYKGTIGYVRSSHLSERNDIPFVDNVKCDYYLNEFAYSKERVIDLVKDAMSRLKEPPSNGYYIDDPQIYTFHGKDCDGENTNYILVIAASKQFKSSGHYTIFTKERENEYHEYASGGILDIDSTEEMKNFIESLKDGVNCL